MRILKYPPPAIDAHSSELERRLEQLLMLARALANEVETLRAEITTDHDADSHIAVNKDGIDFYDAVERYEIELIRSALNQCNGNQSRAARLLRMKSTTLNAKMKHYGLNPVRSITLQPAQAK